MFQFNQYHDSFDSYSYLEQENQSDDSSIDSCSDQYPSDDSDQDYLDISPLQRNHNLNIFNHKNFQNLFQNKKEFVVQVKFSLNENFKQIEQEAINKIGQLFGIQQKPLYQKTPNKNGNQTITLEYKTQSDEKSTELVRNFNLFDPGFQTIYVEKKIKPREFWLMRESYEVILESIQSFPRNLRGIFQFMFDNFGEVHRLQIYGKNKKQIQVIFSNEQAYERFLEELFEEDFYINKDDEDENQEPKKYFYFNNQKIYLYQLSQKDIQKKLDQTKNQVQLFQQNKIYEYDSDEEQKQEFASNQKQNNFDQKNYNQTNKDKKKQLEIEQEEQGKLYKITNLKNILNVTSKLKEFGDLHHYDYQLKPQQTIEFRYNSIYSDQLMIEAYQNLEFSEIDNMDIKIELVESCFFNDQEFEILCQHIFYNKCENKQKNQCQKLHIGSQLNLQKINEFLENQLKEQQRLANKKKNLQNFEEDKEQNENDYKNICFICCTEETTTLFLPCAHFGTCKNCSQSILNQVIYNQSCPFCKKKIQNNVQLIYE